MVMPEGEGTPDGFTIDEEGNKGGLYSIKTNTKGIHTNLYKGISHN